MKYGPICAGERKEVMKKATIREALEEMRNTERQVQGLRRSIRKATGRGVGDAVQGSSRTFPYSKHRIRVEGNSEREKLEKELRKKEEEWAHKARVAERVLNCVEPEMQNILRRYYENGETMESIGEELGYTKGRISQKIKSFFDEE